MTREKLIEKLRSFNGRKSADRFITEDKLRTMTNNKLRAELQGEKKSSSKIIKSLERTDKITFFALLFILLIVFFGVCGIQYFQFLTERM